MGSLTHIPIASCPRRHQPRFQLFFPFLFFSLLCTLSLSLSLSLSLHFVTSPLARPLSPARAVLHRFSSCHQRTHAALVSTLLSSWGTGRISWSLAVISQRDHSRIDVTSRLFSASENLEQALASFLNFPPNQKTNSCHTACFFGSLFSVGFSF